MLRRTLLALVLIPSGGACTTTQPVASLFPRPDSALMVTSERPAPLPASDLTAASALRTVTENYARHHRVADRLDALQSWVRGQEQVK